ncbi:MAG: hypothetical protein NTZ33_14665 [Bacteroidetes bacterium]|nr:hypothetical protein [Bacteroidota bacterium]
MFKKAYILIFDKSSLIDNFNYQQFHTTLTTAKGIESWWHYLNNTYILIVDSKISANNISDFVRQHMTNKHFIVVELNLNNHNGWLPKEAWDWIMKYKN